MEQSIEQLAKQLISIDEKIKKLTSSGEVTVKKSFLFMPEEVNKINGSLDVKTTKDKKGLAIAIGFILMQKNAHELAMKELGLKEEFTYNGITADEWISSIKARISEIDNLEKVTKLKEAKARLEEFKTTEMKRAEAMIEVSSLLDGI